MSPDLIRRLVRRRAPGGSVLFVFHGGSGATSAMGADLYASEHEFRGVIDRACPIVRRHTGIDVLPVFAERAGVADLREAVAALGLVQLGQLALWRSVGLVPDAVAGTSLGEATAAHAAGALSFDDAVLAVAALAYGSGYQFTPHVLFFVDADAGETDRIRSSSPVTLGYAGRVRQREAMLFVAGDDAAVARAHIEATTGVVRTLEHQRPHHTLLAGSAAARLGGVLEPLQARPAVIPCFSSCEGRDIAPDARFDAEHWARLLDRPSEIPEAMDAAVAIGPALVVHLGHRPMLHDALDDALEESGQVPAIVVTSVGAGDEIGDWRRARRAARPFVARR